MTVRIGCTAITASMILAAGVAVAGNRPEAALVEQAHEFMESYARDLCLADRAALFTKYDSAGSYRVGQGEKYFATYEETKRCYLNGWSPPVSFAWDDLSYEIVSQSAVLVTGRFYWGTSQDFQSVFAYTALLLRKHGILKIRLEDESRSLQAGASNIQKAATNLCRNSPTD